MNGGVKACYLYMRSHFFSRSILRGRHLSTRTSGIMQSLILLVTVAIVALNIGVKALKKDECEVCISVVQRFTNSLTDDEKSKTSVIEDKFRNFCKDTKGKDNRFCYYLGGLEESATGILGELSKPISWSMPPDKVCEKLKKKDVQICDLRYDKQIDLNTVDLKKLKVRDLKKILNNWDEDCEGCLEKTDYINRIEELKPIHMRGGDL